MFSSIAILLKFVMREISITIMVVSRGFGVMGKFLW
jgi:hypothetical protein